MAKKRSKRDPIPEQDIINMISTGFMAADHEGLIDFESFTVCERGHKHLKLRSKETKEEIVISVSIEKPEKV